MFYPSGSIRSFVLLKWLVLEGSLPLEQSPAKCCFPEEVINGCASLFTGGIEFVCIKGISDSKLEAVSWAPHLNVMVT